MASFDNERERQRAQLLASAETDAQGWTLVVNKSGDAVNREKKRRRFAGFSSGDAEDCHLGARVHCLSVFHLGARVHCLFFFLSLCITFESKNGTA